MNELIKVHYDNADRPTVLARDLYKELGVKEKYTDWFKRMCEYGFSEDVDYCSFLSESSFSEKSEKPKGGRPSVDHQITIPMAKELCMLQRTDKGKLMPYAKPLQDGLFELKETKNDATAWSGSQTMITPKGRETFRLLMTGI